MINEAQSSLLATIAPLKKILRTIEVLPSLPPEEMIKSFAMQVPGIFSDFGKAEIDGREATLHFELILLVSNARSPVAARQGDARTLGLNDLLDKVLSCVAGPTKDGFTWMATHAQTSKSSAFSANGIAAASVICHTRCELEDALALTDLSDFEVFHADYDLPPFAGAAEHEHWLQEPPSYATAKPALSDHLTLD